MQSKGHLLRVLGIAFGLATVVGSVIGQGILRSPGVVAEATGSPLVIIGLWVAGALIALLTALPFAELAAAIPRAGGQYAYTYRAFGPRVGLAVAFTLMIAGLTTIAMLCFVTGEFLYRLGVGSGAVSPVALGIGVATLFGFVNALGTRVTGASQILLSSLKGAILIALVVALFGGPDAPVGSAEPEVLRNGWLPVGTAILVIVSTYNGWWDVIYYGEELTDPGKQIPRAMFGGILGVGLLYIAINIAMLQVLTPDQMAGSNFVAADAAGLVFGERGDFLLTLFGVLSVGAIANLSVMTNARFVYALARAGILPRALDYVDRRGTPIRAMAAAVVVGAAFILTGSYTAISSTTVTIGQVAVVMTILAVFALRRSEPELKRPYRAWLHPWTTGFALLFAVALLVIFLVQDPFYSLLGCAIVGILWVIFDLVLKRRGVLEPVESSEDKR